MAPQETVFQKAAAISAVVPLDSSQPEMMKTELKLWVILAAICVLGLISLGGLAAGIVVNLRPRHSNVAHDVEKQGFEAKGTPSSPEACLSREENSALNLELKQLMTAAYQLGWYESRHLRQDKTKKKASESTHNPTEAQWSSFNDFSAVTSLPTYSFDNLPPFVNLPPGDSFFLGSFSTCKPSTDSSLAVALSF